MYNLPYGAFRAGDGPTRLGVAIGTKILDLHALAETGLLDDICDGRVLQAERLNPLLALGRRTWKALRLRIAALLRNDRAADARLRELNSSRVFVDQANAKMALPITVGDYVDFYSSLEHATNLGRIFRPDGEALMPNWRHLPIAYHGRSSTIVVGGTPIVRPSGQRKPSGADAPVFGPSTKLDIELEVGFVTGPGNELGRPIPIENARDHIFGLVLVNDWSARDIQAWEYQPLGPFLGKSFATTISPWIVTLEALEPFRTAGPEQEPSPLPYLRSEDRCAYDISLAVELRTQRMRAQGFDAANHLASELQRDVLEHGATARACDGQWYRNSSGRSLRVRNDQRQRIRRLRQFDRDDVERHAAVARRR